MNLLRTGLFIVFACAAAGFAYAAGLGEMPIDGSVMLAAVFLALAYLAAAAEPGPPKERSSRRRPPPF